jgi:hypothetical protein
MCDNYPHLWRALYAKAAKERDELRRENKILLKAIRNLVELLDEEVAQKNELERRCGDMEVFK